MPKTKTDPFSSVLRIIATVISVVLVVILFLIALFGVSSQYSNDEVVIGGRADLARALPVKSPIYLNGQWERFDGVFLSTDDYDPALLERGAFSSLPLGSISASQGTTTWRVLLALPGSDQTLCIYIPNLRDPVTVIFNGQQLKSLAPPQSKESIAGRSIFTLPRIDEARPWQELLISTNQNPEQTALYKRPIVLGTQLQVENLASDSMTTSMFLFGVVLLLLLSGYMFMMLRPEHVVISLITIFDSLLMARIVCGYNDIFFFLRGIFPIFTITDSQAFTLQLFFLLLAGVAGTRLANHLFDPGNRVPRVLTMGLSGLYLLMALVFPFHIFLFEQYGFYALVSIYLLTFLLMPFQILVYLSGQRDIYAMLQLVKTLFIGVVLFLDIMLMNTRTDIVFFTNLYIVFFMAHLFIRLYDNNKSYEAVEELNRDLEQKVADRTAELSQANKVLAEISIRDPLTNAYNRLHFEQLLERTLMHYVAGRDIVHLAIFDLDHFKNINDTYGHHEGDQQLRYVVKAVNGIIDQNTTLARVGGEEFILLFRKTPTRDVLRCLEKIRHTFELEAKANPKRTTASFGVVKYHTEMQQKSLFILADHCLYQAKNSGRNKIVFESPAGNMP